MTGQLCSNESMPSDSGNVALGAVSQFEFRLSTLLIETEHWVEALAGNRLDPVALVAGGGFGPEVKVHGAVRVGLKFVVARAGRVIARVLDHGVGIGVVER